MDPKKWLALVLCVAHWICPVCLSSPVNCKSTQHCLEKHRVAIIVSDKYTGTVKYQHKDVCLMMLSASNTLNGICHYKGFKLKQTADESIHLIISKSLFKKQKILCVLTGKNCNTTMTSILDQIQDDFPVSGFQHNKTGNCSISCFMTNKTCTEHSNKKNREEYCKSVKDILGLQSKLKYMIHVTNPQSNCHVCTNMGPVKPEQDFNLTVNLEDGEETDPAQAVEFMKNLNSLVSQMKGSSASVSLGAAKGVLVKQNENDISEVSVGFTFPKYNMLIADDENVLSTLTRSVLLSKEAFEDAYKSSPSDPFAGVFRFNNMVKDEMNSTVLLNEVIAIDMGANITNLTDTISIHFRKVTEKGIPSCRSWNGEGSLPTWTDSGCHTVVDGDSIACQCSHLTFFAVIMSPLNTTISAADLKSLTYITYIGCGLSTFFLGIAFFMHFLTRRTKASKSKKILIQLMIALFLLNLSFLTNTWVANFNNMVGCRVMGALMHYFMLATFTWFAMNAFHLCLHFYCGGKIVIHRYILKVSIAAWVIPSLFVVVLLILDKYGELAITTDGNEITMCWITNDEIHYIINITYYAVVFLFTFTTFILILAWLCLIKKSRVNDVQMGSRSTDIVSVFGLCCTLGVSWGIAFFAYGVLQLPSYYIFTILNSFQGFFLFLYYYKTSHRADEVQISGSSSSSQNTTKTE